MKNVSISWRMALPLVAILLSSVFTSCSDDEKKLSDLTGFLSFGFSDAALENYEFTIGSDNVITNQIALPYGFDASALTPIFSAAPLSTVNIAGINQVSGLAAMDFTSDIVFTVLAENGDNTLSYTVRVNVATSLSDWNMLTGDIGYPDYTSINAFMLGGKYYIFGGESTNHSYGMYSSADGETWSLSIDNLFAEKGIGVGAAAVKHGDNQLLIGGHTFMNWSDWSTGAGHATVHSSSDGATWEKITETVTDADGNESEANSFSVRTEPMVANLNGDLYLVGGATVAYGNPGSPIKDVWKSTDGGATWVNLESNIFEGDDVKARFRGQLLVYKDELYVIGGQTGWPYEYFNDIYKSADGVNWTKVSVETPFDATSGHICYVYNDRFYLIGGTVVDGEGDAAVAVPTNAVWVSEDAGVNWTKVTEGVLPEGFAARAGHAFVKDGNVVHIFGGMGADADGTAKVLTDSWEGTLN
jgi:hypothetical protein